MTGLTHSLGKEDDQGQEKRPRRAGGKVTFKVLELVVYYLFPGIFLNILKWFGWVVLSKEETNVRWSHAY